MHFKAFLIQGDSLKTHVMVLNIEIHFSILFVHFDGICLKKIFENL